jgi:hypothetical protein
VPFKTPLTKAVIAVPLTVFMDPPVWENICSQIKALEEFSMILPEGFRSGKLSGLEIADR